MSFGQRRSNGQRPWSKRDERIVLNHKPHADWAKTIAKLSVPRTVRAAKQRQHQLRHPELYGRADLHDMPWSKSEIAALDKYYPLYGSTLETRIRIPGRSAQQIAGKASHRGIRRVRAHESRSNGPYKGKRVAHFDLVDQIRTRIKEDGFSYREFDRMLRTGQYFTYGYRLQPNVSLRNVARAVQFFGGTLTIDWVDR